jgi:hypothetical protein
MLNDAETEDEKFNCLYSALQQWICNFLFNKVFDKTNDSSLDLIMAFPKINKSEIDPNFDDNDESYYEVLFSEYPNYIDVNDLGEKAFKKLRTTLTIQELYNLGI